MITTKGSWDHPSQFTVLSSSTKTWYASVNNLRRGPRWPAQTRTTPRWERRDLGGLHILLYTTTHCTGQWPLITKEHICFSNQFFNTLLRWLRPLPICVFVACLMQSIYFICTSMLMVDKAHFFRRLVLLTRRWCTCATYDSLHHVAYYHRQGSGVDDSDDDGDAVELLSSLAALRPPMVSAFPQPPPPMVSRDTYCWRPLLLTGEAFLHHHQDRTRNPSTPFGQSSHRKSAVSMDNVTPKIRSKFNVKEHPLGKRTMCKQTNKPLCFIPCTNFNSSLDLLWAF